MMCKAWLCSPVPPYNLDTNFSVCTCLKSFSHLQGIPGSSCELVRIAPTGSARTSGSFWLDLVLLRTVASMHQTCDGSLGSRAESTISCSTSST